MQFHLEFRPVKSVNTITHQDTILLFGSCFSEHIGNKLSDLKFNVDSNPYGIVFNPISTANLLDRIIHKMYFEDSDVFEKENVWYSLETHSSIFANTKNELLIILNTIIDIWNAKLKQANYIIFTFGSSFAYKHLQQDKLVANCHKLPQSLFQKQLLETEDIVNIYKKLVNTLQHINSKIKIVFTISPVKHLRDGVVENNLSKAILIQAVHSIIKNTTSCSYFPAYELVNDDLRDYRFYESDMAHPNNQAINYVWKRFSEVYFNEATNFINEKLEQIHQAYNHRLFNKETAASFKFRQTFYQKCVNLQAEFAYIDLSKELSYFNTFQD